MLKRGRGERGGGELLRLMFGDSSKVGRGYQVNELMGLCRVREVEGRKRVGLVEVAAEIK